MKSKYLLAASLLALLLIPTARAVGPQYIVIDLGALPVPGGGRAVSAAHISNSGR